MKRDNTLKEETLKLENGTILVASDIHFPYEDKAAVTAFIREAGTRKPDVVVLNGDLLDFYKLSKFSKDPSGKNPEEEIEMCKTFLKCLRRETGKECKIYYTIGNHEARLRKYILDNAPMVAGLMENVFSLLKLEEPDVVGCASLLVNDTFMFKHGSRLGNKSGLSAIKELEAHYLSGATGHCFSEDVEVLTPDGWQKIIDIGIGQLVGTYNKKTKTFEFNKVNDKFVYDNYKELYHIKGNCIDIMTTGKHGFIGYTPNGIYKEFTAEDLSKMSKVKIPLACQGVDDTGIDLDDNSIRLLVNKDGVKRLPDLLRNANKEQARIILEEYAITDGCKQSKNSYQISTSKKEEADLLQEIFVKNGMRSSCIIRTSDKRSPSYVLTVNLRDVTTIDRRNVSVVPYQGKVSCVSVNNGTLVVRSKGKTIITQNTHRLARYSVRKAGRRFIWLETGCLCDLNPEYMVDPDWEQGIGIITLEKGKLKNVQVYPIVDGQVLYD